MKRSFSKLFDRWCDVETLSRSRRRSGNSTTRRRLTGAALEKLEDRVLLTAGGLDPTFFAPSEAPDAVWPGEVMTSFSAGNGAFFKDIAVQSDGKAVAVGYGQTGSGDSDFLVSRYDIDGSLDTTFSFDGRVITDIDSGSDDLAQAVIIQDDESILVVGAALEHSIHSFALARYLPNGDPDPDFGVAGRVLTPTSNALPSWSDVAVRPNGEIVVIGTGSEDADGAFKAAAARYSNTGNLIGSVRNYPDIGQRFVDLAIRDNGRILVLGNFDEGGSFITELHSNLTVNTQFGTNGLVDLPSESANAMALDADGRIIIAGSRQTIPDAAFVDRYLPDGTPDGNFAGGGLTLNISHSQFNDVAVDASGRIVAAGRAGTIAGIVVRLRDDGTLDPDFKNLFSPGISVSRVRGDSIAIAPGGKIVVGGVQPNDFISTPKDFTLLRLFGRDPEFAQVAIIDHGDTLELIGGNSSQNLEIFDYGNGQILVRSLDEGVDGVFDADSIIVNLNGSKDRISYSAVHVPTLPWTGLADVEINTGRGNDIVDLNVDIRVPSFAPREEWQLSINTDAGRDRVNLSIGNLTNVAAEIRTDLGRGNDTYYAEFTGEVSERATAHLIVNGQRGADEIAFAAMLETALFSTPVVIDAAGGPGRDKLSYRTQKVHGRAVGHSGANVLGLNLQGDAGRDSIAVDLLGEHELQLIADGGSGRDEISIAANMPVNKESSIVANGGRGRDTINLKLASLLDGVLSVDLNGGNGADVIRADIDLERGSNGLLHTTLDGGRGRDRVRLKLAAHSKGPSAEVEVLGGRGNDELKLFIQNDEFFYRLGALVDGGLGTDSCWTSDNVRVVNCQL